MTLVALSAPLAAEEGKPDEAGAVKWESPFDGKTLNKWETLKKFDFDNHGKVHVKDGCMILETGQPATGVRWTGKFPKMDYEVTLEGKRVEGGDFFCGMTFPVGDGALTLIMGGWGGWVVGLSCIDGFYAIDNETCQGFEFENGRWYRVRLRVTKPLVEVWIDDKSLIELKTENRKLTTSWEMEPCQPFGFATWHTAGALRNIRFRSLGQEKAGETKPEPKGEGS